MKSDIEIAQSARKLKITEIAEKIAVSDESLELYGHYKAKIDVNLLDLKDRRDGKLILVTAMNPTPVGEGKTTTSVGLADALQRLGKKTILTLREPSLGPVFGIKGGAAGGGYAQVVPMEDINLHFTGDFHAVGAANNLLSALTDNHIHQGNELGLDVRRITWKRCMDMNDRQLRNIVVGLRGKTNGTPREDGFDITVASEIMAILCLSENIKDLRERISRVIVGYTYAGEPVTAGDLKAAGAMSALLKDAIKPNLVQTLEHTPTFIHGGPFANIAHGCNSVMATKTAMKLADYVVTEAGFGADLGAEKFIDIKCRSAGIAPAACVIVATVRAVKHHGGAEKARLGAENLDALSKGMPNLVRHIKNVTRVYGIPAVVALNRFGSDTDAEIEYVRRQCMEHGVRLALSEVWEKGSEGGTELAAEVLRLIEQGENRFGFVYPEDMSLKEKIETIAEKIYGGDGVEYEYGVTKEIARIEQQGYGYLPVCMAKTQYSLSDDPKLIGCPKGFRITVTDIKVLAGAGFVVVYTGDIMTMPGLPKVPSASVIDIDENGVISGLF